MRFKLSYLNSNLLLTLGYLNPALNALLGETRNLSQKNRMFSQAMQYTATHYILITTETTEWHGNFNLFHFQYDRKVDRSTPQSV